MRKIRLFFGANPPHGRAGLQPRGLGVDGCGGGGGGATRITPYVAHVRVVGGTYERSLVA